MPAARRARGIAPRLLRALAHALLVLASTGIALVACDVALRVAGYRPAISHAWMMGPFSRARIADAGFHDRPARAALELFAGPDRDHNPPGQRHLNEAGYRALAEIVASGLGVCAPQGA